MDIENIKMEALELSTENRASLVKELISSLEELPEPEVERLWMDEAILRDKNLNSGLEKCSPVQEVLARIKRGNK